MKIIHKNHSTTVTSGQTANRSHRTFTALVLTGILYLGAGITLIESAAASPAQSSLFSADNNIGDRELISQNSRAKQLPSSIANAVLKDLSSRTGIPAQKLRVTNYSGKTWANGCLGLPKSGEFCTQALIEGWRVVASDGNKTWVYRTDTSGRTLRRENQAASVSLPKSVEAAVLQNVSQQSGLPISALRIVGFEGRGWNGGCIGGPAVDCAPVSEQGWQVTVEGSQQRWVYVTNKSGSRVVLDKEASSIGEVSNSGLPSSVKAAVSQDASRRLGFPVAAFSIVKAEQKKWSNSCLDINTDPRLLCGPAYAAGIPGWMVTVASGEHRLVYRTNESGSTVVLDRPTSQTSITPVAIPTSELPPPLEKNVIFRAIASGGITGRTFQTTLLNNGRVLRAAVNADGTTSTPQTSKISLQQVRKFQQLLEEQPLSQFNQLHYPAPNGAADYITVTLTSRYGTTRYADIASVPEPLQEVIQSWSQITSRTQ